MKSQIIYVTFFLLALSCTQLKQTKRLKGDLYFSLLRIGSLYNQPDSVLKSFENFLDSVQYGSLSEEDRKFLKVYHVLDSSGLLFNPFVDVLVDNDSVVTIYLEEDDYSKIKKYKYRDLEAHYNKVRISATVSELHPGLFYCERLNKVEVTKGQTLPFSSKFKIEDYN